MLSSGQFFIPTRLWRRNKSVPKCQHIKFRRRGIIQKKAYNLVAVWKQNTHNWKKHTIMWYIQRRWCAVRESSRWTEGKRHVRTVSRRWLWRQQLSNEVQLIHTAGIAEGCWTRLSRSLKEVVMDSRTSSHPSWVSHQGDHRVFTQPVRRWSLRMVRTSVESECLLSSQWYGHCNMVRW